MTNDIDPALTGAAFDLANAGYAPMKDPDEKDDRGEIGSDSASLREAAEQRTGAPDSVVIREYSDGNGKPVPANEAVTLVRAAKDYAGLIAAEELSLREMRAQRHWLRGSMRCAQRHWPMIRKLPTSTAANRPKTGIETPMRIKLSRKASGK